MSTELRLGVNIDHVATLRNARGGVHPDPLRAAKAVMAAGGDSITTHLREDRRHIVDFDVERIRCEVPLPLNLEMAATPEMVDFALKIKPYAVCLVPEKREERTTEGGLDLLRGRAGLTRAVDTLLAEGIRVSLFVEPEEWVLEAARALGAPVVELHTGAYCDSPKGPPRVREYRRLVDAARMAEDLGLICHAGHGLTYETVGPVAAIPTISELNIGHFIIGEALFVGMEAAIREMRARMETSRDAALGRTTNPE